MAVVKILTNATTNGVGTGITNAAEMAAYGVTVKGSFGGCFVDVLVDLAGGDDYVVAGSLTESTPAHLILLPAGASCNARISGAGPMTKLTVSIAS